MSPSKATAHPEQTIIVTLPDVPREYKITNSISTYTYWIPTDVAVDLYEQLRNAIYGS